ncbi:MAG: hypothetical protein Q9208_004654 [Pyrenodesmia sp. 3 TL-2023]
MSRFAQPGRHKKEILAMLVVLAVLGFGSLLALTVDCRVVSSTYYWDFPAHRNYCPQPYLRWQCIAAFDAITEFLMLAVPIDLICSLQMPSRRKVGVITAFYIRVPVLALTLVRNHYVQDLHTTSDTGLVSRTVVIWPEAQLAYFIAAATLMCLKPLIRDFNTSFGLGGETVRTHAASGYIASNSNGSGLASKIGRLRAFRGGSKYTKGSTIEPGSSGGDFPPNDKGHVLVSERRLEERPTIQPHTDSSTTTTVAHDPQHRPQGSGGSQGADEIMVTHRIEHSVHPRNLV